MSIGERIKALMAEKKISQGQLARMVGITPSAISQILASGNSPRMTTLEKIAEALEVSVHELMTEPDTPIGWVSMPVIGKVPAGVPIQAIEEHEGEVIVPAQAAKNAIALRVSGNSMIPSIRDGDVVLVKLDPDPDPGSIVVARKDLDGEVTIKRLSRQGKVTLLLPENPDYEPIVFDYKKDWRIIGKVTKLIRDIE